MRVSLSRIESNYDGFSKLNYLYQCTTSCSDSSCEIDMSGVSWFDANMCAPLGAALYQFRQGHVISLPGLNPAMENLLRRNGFLPNFGFDREKVPDHSGTTIEYQRFESTDAASFKEYVARHFVGKGIPDMSPLLHRKFRESISEIFGNAVDHSGTQLGIFACGQFFPKAHRLDFSIADLGIGIRENIQNRIGLTLDSTAAIEWAVSGDNTTRQREDGKPGGLGLKLIREFIKLNEGKMQIISGIGYWSTTPKGIEKKDFALPFPGTVVNIEINTADTKSYCMESELYPEDIF